MRLLFVGVAASEDALRHATDRFYAGRGEVRPQQHFDFTLVEGLSRSGEVVALSEPPVASFPRSSCLLYPRRVEEISPSLTLVYLPVLNLPVLKALQVLVQVLVRAVRFCAAARNGGGAILVGHISVHTALPVLAAARALGVPAFAIVPDLPRLVASYGEIRNPLRRLAIRVSTALTRLLEPSFDGYVFLAEAMNPAINRKGRPYVVVEGMFDDRRVALGPREAKGPRPAVLYAGTLHRKYGIERLVQAFLRPELAGVDLWVLGNGDYLEELRAAATNAPNVLYKGVVGRDEVFRLEQRATLLVNPRPTADEFTRHSFPSKTLEYMASGTPLVSTRLAGIPAEYAEHLYWFDDESASGMARRLAEILARPPADLEAKGARARAFVLAGKTAALQTARIRAFIEEPR